MKVILALVAAVLVSAVPAHAQPRVYSQAELDALLAPVALQPDGIVTQILIAATYPDEVMAAARWSRANPSFRGEEAVRLVQYEPWDPAVKALVAFPELLARMEESPQWLHDLGQAFLVQQAQVLDTVQSLRQRAQAAGHLATTDEYAVYNQGEAIVVQPRTQIVYVRYYDPYVVYGPWWWPHYHPVFWRPWAPRPVFLSYGFFYTDFDWRHRHVLVVRRPTYVHHYRYAEPGRWQHRHRAVSSTRPHVAAPAVRPQPPVTSPVRPHVRVPEAQRRPIVQAAPPAVREVPRQHPAVTAPVRPHARVPEVQRHQQQMPAANAYSQPRREIHQRGEQRWQGKGNASGHGNGHGKGHQREERRHRG